MLSKGMLLSASIGFAIGFSLVIGGFATGNTGLLTAGLYIAGMFSACIALGKGYVMRSKDYIDPTGNSLKESKQTIAACDHNNPAYDQVHGK